MENRPLFSEDFDKGKLLIASLIFFILLLSLFLNLGVQPLYLEEPRRALIALEMIFRDNFIVPTEMGEFYYKKPPLYNWLLIASFKIFGNYSEFACRFFSVLSFLMMGIMVFLMGRKYVSMAFGIYAGFLFLISVEIYFYFSATGEIDLFYSFLTLASFFSLFHFFEQKKYFLMFCLTYFFAALGTLTKGFPSLVFIGITLPVFFYYKKDFKRLFTLPHFTGIFVYLIIVVGYFWYYSRFNGLENYFRDLWSQSSERTVLENPVSDFIVHLFYFPLLTLQNLIPASFFLIFLFRKDFIKIARNNKLIEFCLIILASNILIYWLSPKNRSRYVYMLYPLVVMVLTYFYVQFSHEEQRRKWFHRIAGVIIVIASITCFCLPLIKELKPVPELGSISLLSGFALAVTFAVYKTYRNYRLLLIILTVVILRLVFNFTILPVRAMNTQAQMDKNHGNAIAAITGDEKLHIYQWSFIQLSTVFYIEKGREEVLTIKHEKLPGIYYLTYPDRVKDMKYEVYYKFLYYDQEILLVKFL